MTLIANLPQEQIVEALAARARTAIEKIVETRNPVISIDATEETADGTLIVMLLPRKLADLVMLQMERSVKKAGA